MVILFDKRVGRSAKEFRMIQIRINLNPLVSARLRRQLENEEFTRSSLERKLKALGIGKHKKKKFPLAKPISIDFVLWQMISGWVLRSSTASKDAETLYWLYIHILADNKQNARDFIIRYEGPLGNSWTAIVI